MIILGSVITDSPNQDTRTLLATSPDPTRGFQGLAFKGLGFRVQAVSACLSTVQGSGSGSTVSLLLISCPKPSTLGSKPYPPGIERPQGRPSGENCASIAELAFLPGS